MINFSNNFKLVVLAWSISFVSLAHSQTNGNYVKQNCTITIYQKDVNGTYHNDTTIILGVNRCAEGYQNEDIIRKCEKLIGSEYNSDLLDPVTSKSTNITYWNKFCATCNYDNYESNWLFWPFWNNSCDNFKSEIQILDVNAFNEITRTYIGKGMTLVTELLDQRKLQCSMEEHWPIQLLNHVLPCVMTDFQSNQYLRLNRCQYVEKNIRICTKMRLFIEGLYFNSDGRHKNGFYYNWTDLNFTGGEYIVESGYDSVFYVCEQPEIIYKTGPWGKICITVISLIFISIYLAMNFNKRYFQNFSNRILSSYLVGLIVMHVLLTFTYLSFPAPCVAFYLARFLWFFHFLWTLLIFIEFCLVSFIICVGNTVTESSQRLRYPVYCFFGFVIPIGMPIVYYFRVLESNENYCPAISGHFAVPCNPTEYSGAKFSIYELKSILDFNFSYILCLLVLVFALIYFAKLGFISIRSMPNKNLPIVLMKMTFILSIHWVLLKVSAPRERDFSFTFMGLSIDTIFQLTVDLQGVIVVSVFAIKKSMLGDVLNKLGCQSITALFQSSNDTVGTVQQTYPLSPPSS